MPRAWFGLLARNHFAIGPRRIVMALILSGLSFLNLSLWALQALLYGGRIRRSKIEQDPIFIIGHWRSGTTLLHELLVLDPRHTYPDTYASFCPNHFLVSAWLFKPVLRFLLPSRRPMDNMTAGWDKPQEDEFALCNMGVRSPYLTFAFPNRPPQDQEYLDFQAVATAEVAHWKATLQRFLQCITIRNPKRIVLKSPPHTARIRVLLELFPNAKFVHIVRDPYVIFPSTVNLWKHLYRDQGLQFPRYVGLEEHVFRTFVRMYEAFDRDRSLIPPSRFAEVHYEDLVENPLQQMRKIYEQLELGGFDEVLPAIRQYFATSADYQTNRYNLAPEIREEINRRWGGFMRRYGYCGESVDCANRRKLASRFVRRHRLTLSLTPYPANAAVNLHALSTRE